MLGNNVLILWNAFLVFLMYMAGVLGIIKYPLFCYLRQIIIIYILLHGFGLAKPVRIKSCFLDCSLDDSVSIINIYFFLVVVSIFFDKLFLEKYWIMLVQQAPYLFRILARD